MSMLKNVIVHLTTGLRGVWWKVDLQSIQEHFEECKWNGANPDMKDLSFETYIRPLNKFDSTELDKFNGGPEDHFIFGEMECIGQSDSGPQAFLYPEFNKTGPTLIEVVWSFE